jgi:integrase
MDGDYKPSLWQQDNRPAPPSGTVMPKGPAIEAEQFFDGAGLLRRPPLRVTLVGPMPEYEHSSRDMNLRDAYGSRTEAESTRKTYGYHAHAWVDWCRERNLTPLPADPAQLTMHLAAYVTAMDETKEPVYDEYGQLVQRVSISSALIRLASIDKLHEYAGLPVPGKDPGVASWMESLRRCVPARARNAKAPIDLADLGRLVVAADESVQYLRLRAWVLLRARFGLSVSRTERICWEHIEIDDDGLTITTYEKDGRNPVKKTISRHRDRGLCLVAAVEDLRERSLPVGPLVRINGKPASRRITHHAVTQAAPQIGWIALAGAKDEVLRSILTAPDVPSLVLPTRNVALLTVAWWMALRRSNAVNLLWEEVEWFPEHRSWRALISRSKTDQIGAGRYLWLPEIEDARVCPARALTRWHACISETLGFDPKKEMPRGAVFPRVDKSGTIDPRLRRMDGEVLADLVQDLAIEAGLWRPTLGKKELNPFGGHSLRVGFVTEGLRDHKLSLAEVADVTDHKRVRDATQVRAGSERAAQQPRETTCAEAGRASQGRGQPVLRSGSGIARLNTLNPGPRRPVHDRVPESTVPWQQPSCPRDGHIDRHASGGCPSITEGVRRRWPTENVRCYFTAEGL